MSKDYQTALDLYQNKRIGAAKPLFESAIEQDPDNLDALYKLGICSLRLKEFEAAEGRFRTLTGLDPEHAEAWYYLGLALERQGHDDKAKTLYRVALKLDPELEAARKKLGIDEGPLLPEKGKIVAVQPHAPNAPSQPQKVVFETNTEEGPGELLFASKRRRFGSFSIHVIILFVAFSSIAVMLMMIAFFSYPGSLFVPGPAVVIIFLVALDLVLRSFYTKYFIYERRIDLHSGIIFRHHISIWLFQITNLTYSRNPVNLVTRNATITLETDKGSHRLVGMSPPRTDTPIGSVQFSQLLFQELRNAVREQRGEIKKVFY